MAKLTKAQRGRLEKLATYLEGLPADYEHFGMARYIGDWNEATIKYARENGGVAECGTVACAVGHGPAAGILMPPRFAKSLRPYSSPENVLVWNRYSALFVGKGGQDYADRHLFAWAFGSYWEDDDDHHHGAAARIRYLLDHGAPPPGFERADEEGCWPTWGSFMPAYAPYRIDASA